MDAFRRARLLRGSHAPLAGVVQTVWAVEERLAAGRHWREHRLPRLTIMLTESGRPRMRIGKRLFTQKDGTLLILRSGLRVEEWCAPDQTWHVRYLLLAGPWAAAVDRALRASRVGAFAYEPAPAAWRARVTRAVAAVIDPSPGSAWHFAEDLAALFGAILASPAPLGRDHRMSELTEQWLNASAGSSPSVKELAASLGLSASNFGHRFRREVSESPALWMRRRRVQLARTLLQQGLSVTQTAEQLGFANPFHFSRVFKKVAGVAPSRVAQNRIHSPLHP